jgi:choline transporter-like protein 2/4/5
VSPSSHRSSLRLLCCLRLVVFGYCVPTFGIAAGGSVDLNFKSQFDAQFDDASKEISRGISDLANAWGVILMSAFFALAFSYLYMWLTKRIAGFIIWLCILLVIIGGFFLGYSFLKEANEAAVGTSENRILAYKVAGYIFIACTGVFVLVILGLSSQIKIAIEVVKEGSKAINDMKFIIFFPLVPLAICGAYMVYWIYGALFIFSVSDLESQPMPPAVLTRETSLLTWAAYGAGGKAGTAIIDNMKYNLSTYEINSNFRPLAAYHLFHLLWTVQFLVYFGYFVIAGAVCGWYFTLSDANGDKIVGGDKGGSRAPILASVWRTIRYHLGTIAFASLIIAVVNFIRVTVKYIEMKTRTNPPNYLQKAVFCLINCCLRCIESVTPTCANNNAAHQCNSHGLTCVTTVVSAAFLDVVSTRSVRMLSCGARCGAIPSCRVRVRVSRSSGATSVVSPQCTSWAR